MNEPIYINIADVSATHKNEHEKYEYYKKDLVPRKHAKQSCISIYEVPPGKAAYPYHYHTQNEESFLILEGKGRLTTPEGDRDVSKGDFLFFPANESGAHILVNTSESETLVYIDFDTKNEMNVAVYPESGKIGVYGQNHFHVFKLSDEVDYYHGE